MSKKTGCLFFLTAFIVLFAGCGWAGDGALALEFLRGKATVATYTLERLRSEFAPAPVASFDPHTPQRLDFLAVDFFPVLKKIYGEKALEGDDLEVLFVCKDGFVAAVPIEEFRARRSRMAFAFAGGGEFSLTNTLQANEHIPLGPFYLIWDYADREELDAAGSLYWPYQVVGINLDKPSERYPRMTPPPEAGEAAMKGFHRFRLHCMTCHKVNGMGGNKSIELNQPVNITDRLGEDYLTAWILDPHKFRRDAKMPALPKILAEDKRREIAESIVYYLKSMKTRAGAGPAPSP